MTLFKIQIVCFFLIIIFCLGKIIFMVLVLHKVFCEVFCFVYLFVIFIFFNLLQILLLAQAVGVPVSRRSGGQVATT